MIGPEHESLRPGTGEGFADSVTVAFGDPQAEVHGLVRIGIQPGEPSTGSVLGVLFAGTETVDVAARGEGEGAGPGVGEWVVGDVPLPGDEPLSAWTVRWAGRLELRLTALSSP